jgi:hypothetical protein
VLLKKKKIKKEKGHGNCICGVWILGYFKRMYIKGYERKKKGKKYFKCPLCNLVIPKPLK